jgi:hypothetical protein
MGTHEAEIVLLGIAVLAFAASAAGFLALVWRLSWSLQGFVATELQRSRYEERIIAVLHDYIETQRSTNEQLWMAAQVQADRLNRWTEKSRRGQGSE